MMDMLHSLIKALDRAVYQRTGVITFERCRENKRNKPRFGICSQRPALVITPVNYQNEMFLLSMGSLVK